MSMVKVIVFDMGGVLIDFSPRETLLKHLGNETTDIIMEKIFSTPLWRERDRGILTTDEIFEMVGEEIPEAHYEKANEMLQNFFPHMPPFEESFEIVKTLKKNGYPIYLLSNASYDFYENKHLIPCLELFDGYFISADYHLLKPEKEIYEKFLQKFGLTACECVFIDDVPENVEGAKKCGFNVICFNHKNFEVLKQELRNLGVNI